MSRINRETARFVIAFSYRCDKEKDYENARDQMDGLQKIQTKAFNVWLPVNFAERDSEYYPHIQKYTTRNKNFADESSGSGWIRNKELDKALSLSGTYTVDKKEIPFEISATGLFLFKTGIGFLWYEVDSKKPDIDSLISMNWSLKEVSYNKDRALKLVRNSIEKIENVCAPGDIISTPDSGAQQVVNRKNQYVPAQKLSGMENIKKIYCVTREDSEIYCADVEKNTDFSFMEYIEELLAPLHIVTFFTDRIPAAADQDKLSPDQQKIRPDKAYVFSTVILDHDDGDTDEKIRKYLYWLKRGYKQSYLPPPADPNNIDLYRPFENSFWGASMEGCTNIVRLTASGDTTDTFFTRLYWDRREVYFYLYILVLHQYFTLLNIASEIARLPVNRHQFNNLNQEKTEILNKSFERINLFCMKVYFTQVSHTSHQNELYNYLIKQFDIRLSIKEMRETLQVLNELVQNARQHKRSQYLRVFAIFGGSFALIQTFANIISVHSSGVFKLNNYIPMETFSLSLLGSAIAGSFLLWFVSREKF